MNRSRLHNIKEYLQIKVAFEMCILQWSLWRMGWQEEDRGDGRRTWVGCDSGDKMKLDKSGVHLGDGIAKAWQETAYADGQWENEGSGMILISDLSNWLHNDVIHKIGNVEAWANCDGKWEILFFKFLSILSLNTYGAFKWWCLLDPWFWSPGEEPEMEIWKSSIVQIMAVDEVSRQNVGCEKRRGPAK